jgi:sugar-specific transcriptional regulator TrmB
MSFREDELETLTELGLTSLQAKVYLALAHLGESRASTLSRFSQVTRPDIYRILNELTDLGMVEKTMTKPLSLKATPLQQGIALLLERRNAKTLELKKKTEKIIKRTAINQTTTDLFKNFRFVELPNRGPILKEDMKQKNIEWRTLDIVSSGGRFARWILTCYEDLKEAMSRGIRVRVIVSSSQSETQLSPKKQYLKKLGA